LVAGSLNSRARIDTTKAAAAVQDNGDSAGATSQKKS